LALGPKAFDLLLTEPLENSGFSPAASKEVEQEPDCRRDAPTTAAVSIDSLYNFHWDALVAVARNHCREMDQNVPQIFVQDEEPILSGMMDNSRSVDQLVLPEASAPWYEKF
jgi:hypothetical protein